MKRFIASLLLASSLTSCSFNGDVSANELFDDVDNQTVHFVLSDNYYDYPPEEKKSIPVARPRPYPLNLDKFDILVPDEDYVFRAVDDPDSFTEEYPVYYQPVPKYYPTGDPMNRDRISSEYVIDVIKLLPPEEIRDVMCMALNIYHEARGDTLEGQIATAFVVLNRVKHPSFPDNICDVVWQFYKKRSGGYVAQFSWTRDGRPDRPHNRSAWVVAQKLAYLSMYSDLPDITNGRLNYYAHNTIDPPRWARDVEGAVVIGAHTFLTAKEHLYIAQKEEKKNTYEN